MPLARTPGALLILTATLAPASAGAPRPVDQAALNALAAVSMTEAFHEAFEAGDDLTEAIFTTARGAGANVGAGQRFTRLPRADLTGPGEWASHFPPREGGPQAQSCIACHAAPIANGAGGIALNVAIDPLQSGDPAQFLERNTLPLFGLGAVQRVAEEMTAELMASRDALGVAVCASGAAGQVQLMAKGVSFGTLAAGPETTGDGACAARFDTTGVEGVDADLVVRMFGWKGTAATLRGFARGAAHNEMGLQAVELVGDADGDHDGVTGELSIGDLTAMTVYMAALERPTSRLELDDLGIVPLDAAERARIEAGQGRFADIGCATCHRPEMTLDAAIFREPSTVPGFAEPVLPSGADAAAMGLAPATAVAFDLTADQPNNRLAGPDGGEIRLGSFQAAPGGGAVVRWYSDFRRHDMGAELADPVDAYGFGASVWPTRSLAGVGSTGPWLHHGHATTLQEAILAHGGEAQAARNAFAGLEAGAQAEIVAFLENLIIAHFDPPAAGN